MNEISLIFLTLSTIILFLHSLEGFAHEINHAGQDYLKDWLNKATANRFGGFILGTLFTGLVQSSSVVSALTVSLVEAGTLSLKNSLAVLLGANVGTTSTAWLVTLNASILGPILIVVGGVAGMIPGKMRFIGKPIFYLGFIFFSLNLISESLEPLRQSIPLQVLLTYSNNIMNGVIAGIFVTLILQSSSVVSGMAVILVQQGILSLPGAVAIIIGANIGTTSTALIAVIKLDRLARLSAFSNFIFNITGAVIMIIVFPWFIKLLNVITQEPYQAVAYAHLLMNLMIAMLFLPFLNPFYTLLLRFNRVKEST